MRLLILLFLLPLAGCAWLPKIGQDCSEPQSYESAREVPPLQAPEGMDPPDTRNALRIPEVRAPQLPRDRNRCLDRPPPYAETRPATG